MELNLSTMHRETRVKTHVLGYGVEKTEVIMALTQPVMEAGNRLFEKQAAILIGSGYRIDLTQVDRDYCKFPNKRYIMYWLHKTGQVPELFGEFYRKTFKNGGICDLDTTDRLGNPFEYIDVFDAVRAIRDAGGLAVLAHPGQQQNFQLIPKLAEIGLSGLELNHYSNSVEDREILLDMADRYNLFLTGGSDYHGRLGRKSCGVGDILSDVTGMNVICNHVGG